MANKKINQLVSKTASLSTDLFGIGDATTGQLFKKTIAELQAAIGGAVISVNGLVGTVVLDTDDIQELASPTNKYFTDARARGAISLTVTGNSGASTYSSGTGVLNVPTYTLAGLGGITASFLSGTSGISYNSTTGVISYSGTVYTDASIRALLSGGTGISYNSSTGAISYSGTVYTDSSVRALISLTTTGTSGASTYNNTTGVINVPDYTLAGLGGISLTSLSGGTGITYNSSTGAISYSGTVYTDASVRALISASGAVSYNNTTGVISLTSGNLTEATSSVLTITGGTGAVIGGGTSIQVNQASTSVSGFLSSTDWNTFNNKQATVTLTTTGTSGAATFSANTLNIPNYGSALSGYLPLTGGTLTGALSGTSATFNAQVGITTTSTTAALQITLPSNANATILQSNGSNSGYGWKLQQEEVSTGDFRIFRREASVDYQVLNLARATGAATFSNLITVSGFGNSTFSSGGTGYNKLTIRNTTAGTGNGAQLSIGTNADPDQFYVQSFATTFTTSGMNIAGGAVVNGEGPGGLSIAATQSNIGFYTNGSADANLRMTITSAGIVNLYSPTTNADSLNLYNSSGKLNIKMGGGGGSANQSSLSMYNASNTLTIGLNGAGDTDPSFITGYLAIGTTTNSGYRLYVSGTIYATGNITANSDLTLKKNLELITNPTDKLMQLNGYAYQWKSDDSHQYGVIAQEVEKILPYAVSTGYDGIKGVSYNQIIPVLIEAVKEQKKELEELRNILASK